MAIKTTINIDRDTFEAITIAAAERNVTKSKLIIDLIKKYMHENPENKKFKAVQYQKYQTKDCWHTFHISLEEDDYDYFTDLRNFFKMSVSLILAQAVKKYLTTMTANQNSDNYTSKGYIILKDIINDTITWRIYWGIPHTLPEKL